MERAARVVPVPDDLAVVCVGARKPVGEQVLPAPGVKPTDGRPWAFEEMPLLANTYLTTDPAWPWSLPGVGITALLGVALALAALTVVTYLGAHKATARRITLVVLLRLLALAVALIVVLRPSLARDEEDSSLASKLLVFLDVSESMNVTDEFNNLSRYEHARRLLTTAPIADLLKRLSVERKVEIAYFMGA